MSVPVIDIAGAVGVPVVDLGGLPINVMTEAQAVEFVLGELRRGRGGRVATINVDFLRAAGRDPALKRLLTDSSLLVADGMPLVWAAALRGTPVPERVTGASLVLSLSRAAALEGRSVYLLGGGPARVAESARDALRRRYPTLEVAGVDAPPPGFDQSPAEANAVCARIVAAAPDIVFVGLGFPKQERLIARVAPLAPGTWFLGCGAAISFAARTARRAPVWMQRSGLEWLFRLAREPRRLGPRYLVYDVPFAGRLLASAVVDRFSGRIV